jgi:uncharacterized membrane protein HdeD (DUF308 family)
MASEAQSFGKTLLDGIQENAGTAIGIGIFLLIAGVLALGAPFMTGISITLMIGVLMIIGGVAKSVLAFRVGAFGRGVLVFLMGVLMVVVGIYMVSQPVAALASMTLFLAAYFIVTGIVEFFAAFGIRPAEGWGWMLLNGIVTLLLGLMIWRQFPVSGVWALGTLFGIKLLFSGASLLGLGMAVRRGVKTVEAA